MNLTPSAKPIYSGSLAGRARSLLALGLAVLTLLAVFHGSFHQHRDLDDHPECAVCAFVNQISATALAVPTVLVTILLFVAVLAAIPCASLAIASPVSLRPGRGPPQ